MISRRAVQGAVDDLADLRQGEAVDLEVGLHGGDAVARAGDLEVHVAEVVFQAGDVGEDAVVLGRVVVLRDQAHRHAGHRRLDRHTGVHQRHAAGTNAGLRGAAVGLPSDFGDHTDRVGELVLGRQHGLEGALTEGAVAELATAGAAHAPHFTDRVGREVVVVHEALLVFRAPACRASAPRTSSPG